MTSFRRSALISTLATYFLIFVGGLVRVAGAGLGCPDWPKCFGRWIPPTDVSQIPAGIDPATFNFTLAWIEYVNRLFGVLLGFLIVITAILAIRQYRNVPRIFYSSLAALCVVGFQGWYGSLVVGSELLPITVSVHMLLAFLLAGLLIYATQQAYYIETPGSDSDVSYPNQLSKWLWILAGLTLLQIVLGTQIRSAIEIIQVQFPELARGEWLDRVGSVQNVHWIVSIVMLLITWQISRTLVRQKSAPPLLIKLSSHGLMLFIAAQIVVGIVIVTTGIPEIMQLFHLWFASLYFGVIVILLSGFNRSPEKS